MACRVRYSTKKIELEKRMLNKQMGCVYYMKKSNNYVLRMISNVPLLICSGIPNKDCWIYELNNVGKIIWEICDEYETVEKLIAALDDYFINPLTEEQQNDVRNYLTMVKEKGLIYYEN